MNLPVEGIELFEFDLCCTTCTVIHLFEYCNILPHTEVANYLRDDTCTPSARDGLQL